MAIGSVNHAISFLGVRGAARIEAPHAAEDRRRVDGSPLRPAAAEEPAVAISFSAEALERAANAESDKRGNTDTLSKEDRAAIQKLKQRDQEVRRHEQAHKAAAGKLASGGPSFSFTRGPDGKQYAVSGEVQIDVSPVAGDPAATIAKMRQVQSAARAPAHPSGADLKVAASAAKQEAAARAELRETQATESTEAAEGPETPNPAGPVRNGPENDSSTAQTRQTGTDQAATRPIPTAYQNNTRDQAGGLLNLVA